MSTVDWWREPPMVAALASILTLVASKLFEMIGSRNALKQTDAAQIRELLMKEVESLRRENREQRDEIRRLDGQMDTLRAEKAQLQQQVTDLQARVQELEQRLRAMAEHQGWKKGDGDG